MNHALAAFPSRHDAEKLIDSLFLYAETNYYYFDERDLRARIQRLYDRQSQENDNGLDFIALALVSLALGSQVADFNGISLQVADISVKDQPPGTGLMHHAEQIIPSVMTSCSVESLQCCLLMAICLLPIAGPKVSYIYLSVALKIAISLGLHRKPDKSPADEELQRVFWTTYVIER